VKEPSTLDNKVLYIPSYHDSANEFLSDSNSTNGPPPIMFKAAPPKLVKENEPKEYADIMKHPVTKTYVLNTITMRYHQLYICKHCDMRFKKITRFQEHLRIHLNDKPFVCNGCDKAFVQKGNLKRHVDRQACYKRKPRNQ
jgi:uncharacterized Zn-finger protein